jgi:putative ABC transport system permease protein
MVVTFGFRLALAGIAIGLVASLAVARLMQSLLFGVNNWDAPTFVGVAGLLCLVVFAACCIPARRAMRVDPIIALRHE